MRQGYAAPRAALLLWSIVALASANEVAQYENHTALTATLQALALEHPDVCQLTSVGISRGGRDLWALQLSTTTALPATSVPSIPATISTAGASPGEATALS